MIILDHHQLKRDLCTAFRKFYPEDVADALAVMHAQMHLRFAQQMIGVQVDDRDPRRLVQAAPKLVRAMRGMVRNSDPIPKDMRDLLREDLREEMISYFASVGPDRGLSYDDISLYMSAFKPAESQVRKVVLELEKEGIIHRGKKTRGCRYHFVPEDQRSSSQSSSSSSSESSSEEADEP